MRKRKRIKRKNNVLFFPGAEKKLIDKGMENLQNKNYSEAIRYLEEANVLDPNNEQVLFGLVFSYIEAGSFEKAKALTTEMLQKGIGDYIYMVELYLTILVHLHEYEEIITTIEALYEENAIPFERYDHFKTMLHYSRKMAENHIESENTKPVVEKMELEMTELDLHKLSQKNLNEQMAIVTNITNKNIRPYLNEIEAYLADDNGHPFIKTILLSLLKEQEVDRKIIVRKFNMEIEVIPHELPGVKEQPQMLGIKSLSESYLENENPTLLMNITEMLERIFYMSYPFELHPTPPHIWAAALHYIVQQYLGLEPMIGKIVDRYLAAPDEIAQVIEQIEEIEKISYPNL
ncbi:MULTISPECIES: lipopolysaccharide assembly protein LapB [Neobacillus]|jgi:tetratricopeptide (TPR) repeat protein|uniref:tetratricopeptide repeat protein n=1 Tax=Neobacillus TaxID=2675232 RepID=UPI0004F7028A|nr:tetratricopeptide repeat protein [Neobacillus sedimentimangrovi]AIM15798.1 hypothetical protein HW35_05280 [Bacillus sp. X1(2014)]